MGRFLSRLFGSKTPQPADSQDDGLDVTALKHLMGAADSSPSENSLEVTPSQVASQLTRGEIRLVDVRTPHEYQIASIAGSILLDQAKVEEVVETWPKDGAIVTLCHHGIRSLDAAIFLRGKGFTNVRSMTGGIEAWSRTIDPAIPRY